MATKEEKEKCSHLWIFLRQNNEKDKDWDFRYFDVFYCSKCLSYTTVEVADAN